MYLNKVSWLGVKLGNIKNNIEVSVSMTYRPTESRDGTICAMIDVLQDGGKGCLLELGQWEISTDCLEDKVKIEQE